MKSKTSCFNGTLFLNTIKRFWPIFAAYLLIWLIILPLTLSSSLEWASHYSAKDLEFSAAEHILGMGTYGAPIMAAIFGLLFVMAAFSYLYNPGSVSMVSSLPIKRESVFLSMFSTGLVGMFVSNITVFLVTLAVQSAYGITGASFLLQWLAMTCLNCLFFYGFAVFCACLTGHILVLPFLYAVLNFVAIVVEFFTRATIGAISYGLDNSSNYVLEAFSPFYHLIFERSLTHDAMNPAGGENLLGGLHYDGWTSLIIYGAVGIIFAALSLLLLKQRRMETAADVVAVKPLKPIFKYCMTLGSALVIGVALTALVFSGRGYGSSGKFDIIPLLLCMIFGAFIGYFAAEMMIQKTLRVFSAKAWKGFSIAALLIIALICAFDFDVFGFEKKIPEADAVSNVTISGGFEVITLDEAENIESVIDLHKSIVSNKAEYEKQQYTNSGPLFPETILYIEYELNNGKLLNRRYTINNTIADDYVVLNEIINCDEAVLDRKNTNNPVTTKNFSYGTIQYYDISSEEHKIYELNSEEAVELYSNCIVPDIENRGLGNIWLDPQYSKVNGLSYSQAVYDCTISIELVAREATAEYAYEAFYTTVTIDALNTLDWLSSHGIEPSLIKDISPEYEYYKN